MFRRRFSIAGLLAVSVLMIAADASQAQLFQRLRSRLGRGTDDSSSTSSGRFLSRRSYYRGDQTAATVASNQVALDIRVPSNAEVTVNGEKMTASGSNRTFTSSGLTAGQTYKYTVKANWMENGKQMSKERAVEAQPGQRTTVDLTPSADAKKMPPQGETIKQPKESQ
jgi:uncharacterized protein (TIGR03000 family)